MEKSLAIVVSSCFFLPFVGAFTVPKQFEIRRGFRFYPFPGTSPNGYKLESTIKNKDWIVRIFGHALGEDFITFLATDKDRPLDFPCVKATTICDYSITQKVGEKSSIIIYVHITKLALMAPAMVGNLLLCIAKENMFRLRPLMQRNADYLCTPLGKNTTVIIDHLTADDYNCYAPGNCNAYPLDVEPRVLGGSNLDIHTWYMTKENYEEMYAGETMAIFAPLLAKNYKLNVYANVYTYTRSFHTALCKLIFPKRFTKKMKMLWKYNYITHFYYRLRPEAKYEGMYTVQCVTSSVGVMKERHENILRKRFILRIFEGILIILSTKSDKNLKLVRGREDTVWIPPDLLTATLDLTVHSISLIENFEIFKYPSEDLPFTMEVEQLTDVQLDHSVQFKITLSRVTDETNGRYLIYVQDQASEMKKTFRLFQVKRMKILVGPSSIAVEEGSLCKLYCAVDGNIIDTVDWAREAKPPLKDAELETVEKSNNSTVVRLTLKRVQLTDSGVYICTGSNEYEQISAISKLLVWPKGDARITDRYEEIQDEAEAVRLPPGPYVLNVTDEEIIRGYKLQHQEFLKKVILPTLLSAASLAALVFIVTAIVLWVLWKKKRRLQRQLERRNRRAMKRQERAQRQAQLGMIAPVISDMQDPIDRKKKKQILKLGKIQQKRHDSTDLSSVRLSPDDDESEQTLSERKKMMKLRQGQQKRQNNTDSLSVQSSPDDSESESMVVTDDVTRRQKKLGSNIKRIKGIEKTTHHKR